MSAPPPDEPQACAIVLNWNRPGATIECLNSLYPSAQRRELALVVVDNGSTDDSVEQLSKWGAERFRLTDEGENACDGRGPGGAPWDFALVQRSSNGGYAAGNNLGLDYAMARAGIRYVWILNNDTVVHPDALQSLLSCVRRLPYIDIFGSTIVQYEHPDVVECAGGCRYWPAFSHVRNVLGGMKLDRAMARSAEVWLDYASGAAMFCRTEMFKRVGRLDERFFMYYEELDLARRVRACGGEIAWCKHSIVHHRGGAGADKEPAAASWARNYNENVSTLLYSMKHHAWLVPVVLASRLAGKLVSAILRGQPVVLTAFLAACRDTLRRRPENEKDREGRTPRTVLFGVVR